MTGGATAARGQAGAPTAPEGSFLYFVNTTSDTVIAGRCANGGADCSLRGAIQAANSHIGDDGIEFSLPAGSVIDLTQALPDLSGPVTIAGPGANLLTVQRSTGGNYRIFNVTVPAPGIVTISGLTIRNGLVAGQGGGINNASTGTLNVISSTIRSNAASNSDGGGISNSSTGTVNVTNSTLRDNTANSGGGIQNAFNNAESGTVNVTNTTLIGNQAQQGAGINNFGTLNVVNSTFTGQICNDFGGGIANFGSPVNITNSTFSGNQATHGGGFFNSGSGPVNISNSTFSGHFGSQGGGVYVGSGPVTLKSNLIARNGADLSGSFTSAGFNLIGKNDGAFQSFPAGNPNINSDIVGTNEAPIDPKLETEGPNPFLKDNGGPTPTIALLFGSPAIDRGTSNGLTGPLSTDQRGSGFPRTFDDPAIANASSGGTGADIGAFEVQTAAPPSPTPTPTATPPSSLGNISTRLRVLNGDNALFGGMIAIGTGGKKVIIRAIGPTLTDLGLAGALQDPTLDLFQGNVLIGSNDDWRASIQQAEIANSGFAPNKDAESAIIVTLTPNQNYSAIVRGKNGETGIGVVEAFDLDVGAASKLGNISTRGFVDLDDNVMIAGLIVIPSNAPSLKVLVRALGPTLGDFGVQGFLANPTLDLVNASGTVLRSNDSWQSDQGGQIQAANLAPKYDQEAALIETLTPGQYTAIVRGSSRTTGVGLVEVYNIP